MLFNVLFFITRVLDKSPFSFGTVFSTFLLDLTSKSFSKFEFAEVSNEKKSNDSELDDFSLNLDESPELITALILEIKSSFFIVVGLAIPTCLAKSLSS